MWSCHLDILWGHGVLHTGVGFTNETNGFNVQESKFVIGFCLFSEFFLMIGSYFAIIVLLPFLFLSQWALEDPEWVEDKNENTKINTL